MCVRGDLKGFPSIHKRRFGYILRENERVLKARDALREGDIEELGRILVEAHGDIAKNYHVSCGELDYIVRKALEFGAYGARLTGTGFGGASVIIADEGMASDVARELLRAYSRAFKWKARYFLVKASEGVKAELV